jgi:hypothetical protein
MTLRGLRSMSAACEIMDSLQHVTSLKTLDLRFVVLFGSMIGCRLSSSVLIWLGILCWYDRLL